MNTERTLRITLMDDRGGSGQWIWTVEVETDLLNHETGGFWEPVNTGMESEIGEAARKARIARAAAERAMRRQIKRNSRRNATN